MVLEYFSYWRIFPSRAPRRIFSICALAAALLVPTTLLASDNREAARNLIAELKLDPQEVAKSFGAPIYKWRSPVVNVFVGVPFDLDGDIRTCSAITIDADLKRLSDMGGPKFVRTSTPSDATILLSFGSSGVGASEFVKRFESQVSGIYRSPVSSGGQDLYVEIGFNPAEERLIYYLYLVGLARSEYRSLCEANRYLLKIFGPFGTTGLGESNPALKEARLIHPQKFSELMFRILYGVDFSRGTDANTAISMVIGFLTAAR